MLDNVIDLSHWQTVNSFAQIKSSGIDAVFLKATQGSSWVDSTFANRLAAATSSGLLVGAYHFCDASLSSDQVRHFLSIAESVSVLALDVESNGLPGQTVTIPQAAEIAAMIHMATDVVPVIYIGRYGPNGKGTGLPNGVLSRCPLWLASYSTKPVCPAGWSDWTFWQYTDGTVGNPKSVPGVSKCDRSKFNGMNLKDWWELYRRQIR